MKLDGLTEAAPAKVNLYLHVVGRRPDGYHELDSLAVFAGAADRLRVEAADILSCETEGDFAPALRGETDNLVLRAARLLADHFAIVPHGKIILHKALPVASGIGGGSADAAAALRLLARYWDVPVTDAFGSLAARLGADVPVCLASTPARMRGIGEELTPAPILPPCGLVLVNPGVAVATPAVFRARTGSFSPPASLPAAWPDPRTMAQDLAALGNDLQPPAITIAPAIATVLQALEASAGCLLARMSGSGATCFALYDDADTAMAAANAMRRPGWWCWGGGLAPATTARLALSETAPL